MTTRYEAEVADIERMTLRPRKGEQVTKAMIEYAKVTRQREKERIARTKELGDTIGLAWADGDPKKWDNAIAMVTIGGVTRAYEVEPYEERDGKTRLKPKVISKGYKGMVEGWALWKWHSDRGSEIDDADNFILDCDPPKFVWEVVEVKTRKKAEAA